MKLINVTAVILFIFFTWSIFVQGQIRRTPKERVKNQIKAIHKKHQLASLKESKIAQILLTSEIVLKFPCNKLDLALIKKSTTWILYNPIILIEREQYIYSTGET